NSSTAPRRLSAGGDRRSTLESAVARGMSLARSLGGCGGPTARRQRITRRLMCGIAGVLRPDGVDRADLDRMIRSLQHRGPDGRGALVAGAVGFGHTRLAVIDPRSSTQPMATRDGRCWLTFNGELYNYRELAKELEREAPLSTRGDTEVPLRLLARDGTSAL